MTKSHALRSSTGRRDLGRRVGEAVRDRRVERPAAPRTNHACRMVDPAQLVLQSGVARHVHDPQRERELVPAGSGGLAVPVPPGGCVAEHLGDVLGHRHPPAEHLGDLADGPGVSRVAAHRAWQAGAELAEPLER